MGRLDSDKRGTKKIEIAACIGSMIQPCGRVGGLVSRSRHGER